MFCFLLWMWEVKGKRNVVLGKISKISFWREIDRGYVG